MGKFFLKLFFFLLIINVTLLFYLSYFGIETDKFDKFIKNQANEVNENVKLEFERTKIHLNLTELNLALRLQKPQILVKNNEINLSRLDLYFSIKDVYKFRFFVTKS